jgi:hypothetical protein
MAKPCFDIGYGNKYWSYFMLREFGNDFEPDFLKFWNDYTGAKLDEYDLRLLTENSAVNLDDYKIYTAAKKKSPRYAPKVSPKSIMSSSAPETSL